MFVHLHGHSTFSFLEAIGRPAKIAAKAKELWMPAIAITDYNWMFGAVRFYKACKDEWIKAIIGVELGFVLDINSANFVNNIGNLGLLAKNTDGYLSLLELTSWANTIGIKDRPKIDLDVLKKFSNWVLAFFGGPQSWIGKMILRDEAKDKIVEIIRMLQSALGEDSVYWEIIAQNHQNSPELARVNAYVYWLCEELGIPCIVNPNFHYISKEDKEAWEIALAVKDAKKVYDQDRRKPEWDFYIMTRSEVENVLTKNWYDSDQIQKMISNNLDLSEILNVEIPLGQTLFPNYESPDDIKEIYAKNKDILVENE